MEKFEKACSRRMEENSDGLLFEMIKEGRVRRVNGQEYQSCRGEAIVFVVTFKKAVDMSSSKSEERDEMEIPVG